MGRLVMLRISFMDLMVNVAECPGLNRADQLCSLNGNAHSLSFFSCVADTSSADSIYTRVVDGQEDGLESRVLDALQLVS